MAKGENSENQVEILISPHGHFQEIVWDAKKARKVGQSDVVASYLAHMLEHYMVSDNFYIEDENTGKKRLEPLAEMWLKANQLNATERNRRLRRLGDISLYVSGLFGDSLKRKVVDIDYYAELGGTAYESLAAGSPNEAFAEAYSEFGQRFLEYVDVLAVISEKASMQITTDLLRLYDKYVVSGSKLAEEKLNDMGQFPNTQTTKKYIS